MITPRHSRFIGVTGNVDCQTAIRNYTIARIISQRAVSGQGKRKPFSLHHWYHGMSVVATLCDLRTLIV
ncbi:MAG TPA: hypothetical protein PLM07_21475, partial [Candidatus Rifleibacterium sp.]|nr:hypothetical protein [Candidatus Rifleibacterium sp.]